MATEYFKNFPSINYKGKELKNILLRATIKPATLQNKYVYMPLTVQEGERPDTVANDLYKNSFYDWAVRLVNNQIDPYYDWYMTSEQFEKFLISKYGSIAAALDTIIYYRNIANKGVTINPYTYSTIDNADDYEPINAYDYEEQINEAKKNIDVLQPLSVQNFDRELEKKLNE